jgi:hypothetical protein
MKVFRIIFYVAAVCVLMAGYSHAAGHLVASLNTFTLKTVNNFEVGCYSSFL